MQLKDVTGNPPNPRIVPESPRYGKHLIGIEIELERMHQRDEGSFWRCVDDPSLRNSGGELVLREPVGGLDLENAFHELRSILNNHPEWQANERCSVHCHLDFRDSTVQDVVAFYVTWLLFEASMYTVSGKDRYTNIYCPGASSCATSVTSANALYRSTSRGEIRGLLERWSKYTGVNLRSLVSLGSIEVRTHRGTMDVSDLEQWVVLLKQIKEYSTGKDPASIIKEATGMGRVGFAHEVFGSNAYKIICDNWDKYYTLNYMNACDVVNIHALSRITGGTDIDKVVQAILAHIGE